MNLDAMGESYQVSIDDIIDDVLRREGGPEFTNNPDDRGGATRWGVTLDTLADWRKPAAVTVDDVRALTENEARDIYRDRYITRPGYDAIENLPLLAMIVDTAVHVGPDRTTRWIQAALDVPVDGSFGPQTVGMLKVREPTQVYCFVLAERARHYARLYKDLRQRRFAAGWTYRLADFIEKTPVG